MQEIEFLYLNQAEILAAGVDMASVLAAVEDSFRMYHTGEAILPHKVVLDMDERERGRGNAMPGYVGGDYNVFGVKWISGFPKNPMRFGLPRGIGLLILNDAENGLPLAVMDCTWISAMRTGAATGVGAKYLARPDSKSVAIIGAGVQARTQLEALKVVLPGLEEVRAYDVRHEAAEAFAQDMGSKLGMTVRPVESPQEAVSGADIVVTVTVADEPIVKDAWMKPGSLFAAIGSYQEEEFAVVENSDKVFVDGVSHVLHRETPVIALMIERGTLREEDVGEIGAVICGDIPGRETADERIFYSPIGMGIHDVCVGKRVYDSAVARGLGSRLPLLGSV